MLFDDSVPIFCGGYDDHLNNCECFRYKQSRWLSFARLSPCRWYSGFGYLTNQLTGKTKFVVAGGENDQDLSKVEAFDGTSWHNLPDLPSSITNHCMVTVNEKVLLLIGGWTGQSTTSKTYFFNSEKNEWSPGPDLSTPRSSFACATVNWKNPSGGQSENVVVAAGGKNKGYIWTVELLYINNISRGWQPGPELPHEVSNSELVEYKDSVVLVGGYGNYGRYLYQLSTPDGPWIKMEQTLPVTKHDHVAFLIPDELADCRQA